MCFPIFSQIICIVKTKISSTDHFKFISLTKTKGFQPNTIIYIGKTSGRVSHASL